MFSRAAHGFSTTAMENKEMNLEVFGKGYLKKSDLKMTTTALPSSDSGVPVCMGVKRVLNLSIVCCRSNRACSA